VAVCTVLSELYTHLTKFNKDTVFGRIYSSVHARLTRPITMMTCHRGAATELVWALLCMHRLSIEFLFRKEEWVEVLYGEKKRGEVWRETKRTNERTGEEKC
jgi:hypothetical protein